MKRRTSGAASPEELQARIREAKREYGQCTFEQRSRDARRVADLIVHLGFNAYGRYVFGSFPERFYGGKRLFILVGGVWCWVLTGFQYRRALPERVFCTMSTGMLPWLIFSIGIRFLAVTPFDNAAYIDGLVMRSQISSEEPRFGEWARTMTLNAWPPCVAQRWLEPPSVGPVRWSIALDQLSHIRCAIRKHPQGCAA